MAEDRVEPVDPTRLSIRVNVDNGALVLGFSVSEWREIPMDSEIRNRLRQALILSEIWGSQR